MGTLIQKNYNNGKEGDMGTLIQENYNNGKKGRGELKHKTPKVVVFKNVN